MAMMLACGADRIMKISNMNKTDILSPQYPEEYPNNMKCSWLILAKEREIIKLTLEDNGYELEDKYGIAFINQLS